MTINELYRILELAIHDGHGDSEIFFDTEARTFNYHMAKISKAFLEDEVNPDESFLWLGE